MDWRHPAVLRRVVQEEETGDEEGAKPWSGEDGEETEGAEGEDVAGEDGPE